MLKKIKKKNLIGIIIFSLFTIFVTFFVANSNLSDKDVNTTEKRDTSVSIGTGEGYEDWQYGNWEIESYYSYGGNYILFDDEYSTAFLTSENGNLEENFVSFAISSVYTAGTLTKDASYKPLDIMYELPLSIFNVDTSNYTYSYNEEAYRLSLLNGELEEVAYISLGDVMYCEEINQSCLDSGSIFVGTVNNNHLLLYNGVDIAADEDFFVEFYLDYSVLSSEIIDDEIHEFTPSVNFMGESVTLNTLYTQRKMMEEEITLDNIYPENQIINETWSDNWGNLISGYDYYIEYSVWGNVEYSSNYLLNYNLDSNGDLLVYSNNGFEYYNSDLTEFNGENLCNLESSGYNDVSCYFVVGYKFDGISTLDTYFNVYLDLFASDKNVTNEFDWNYQIVGENEKEEIIYPVGTNKDYTHTLISDDAGIGALDKIKNNKTSKYVWKTESSSNDINVTNDGVVKAFNLWNLTNEGTTNYKVEIEHNGGVIDSSFNSVIDPYTLGNNEYEYKSFYVIDDIEYDYVLSTDRYLLETKNISDYTPKMVYVKIDGGTYELIGSYRKESSGNIVYVSDSSKTENNTNVSETNPVILPDNVTDIKVVYSGKTAALYMGIVITSELSSSTNLIDKIGTINQDSTVLKNNASLLLDDALDNTKAAGTYLTSLYETSSYYGSDSIVNDVYVDNDGTKYDSVTYKDYVYEQIDYSSDGNGTDALDYFSQQNGGTIYELLPIGAILDGEVEVTTYNNDLPCNINLTSIENYEGTGRTLLKIVIDSLESNVYQGDSYLRSGYNVKFNVLYSNVANQSYGNTLNKDFAYYSNSSLTNGFKNASEANISLFTSKDVQNAIAKLDENTATSSSVYNKESTVVSAITVTVGSYIKETKNDNDVSYSENTSVIETGNYRYKLSYVFASDIEEITNLVFVDKLESAYGANRYFKGYFDSVDTSYLNNLGVTTTIYYSTNSDVNLENVDLNDTNSWSTTKPSDASKVVAVAVSCGNYIFKGSDNVSPMIYINMIASNSYSSEVEKNAYNSSFVNYNYIGDAVVKKLSSETTTVKLNKAEINVSATTSVGSGTELLPAIVEDSFSYEVSLNNSGTNTYKNIEFELTLPEGLSLDASKISEKSSMESINGVTDYNKDTRILKYLVSEMLPLETKDISVPVTIDYAKLGDKTSFMAKVLLTKLGNKDYNSSEIKLYNKLAVPELEFAKYVDTADTDGYTDQATVLIGKSETYSYKVVVNNISEVDAKNVLVVDNIPSGLLVDETSITNGGVYDSVSNTITWNISNLDKLTKLDLIYSVKVDDNISLGTVYRSNAHVTVVNPIDNNLKLYDDDTNIVSTLYQIVSNIKVMNTLTGQLADNDKEFTYNFEFSGDASYVGKYDVVDKNGNNLGTLSIDSLGKGSYTTKLKNGDAIEFKMLPNSIDYIISQDIEEGYVTTASSGTLNDKAFVITGTTNEIKQVDYTYNNSYTVSTSLDISAKITYKKDISANMFSLKMIDSNMVEKVKFNNDNGVVKFDTINYTDVEGTYTYTITQVNNNINNVIYDTNIFKVVVKLVDDGKGTLNKEVKYYDKANNEVDEIVFNNDYVSSGLIINNVNTSDYVDVNKKFKFIFEVTDSIDSVGTYAIKDKNDKKINDLIIDENGNGKVEVELGSDDKFVITELPSGTKYSVKQELVEYYTTEINSLTYTIDNENNVILYNGIMGDTTIQIDFKNNYVTCGEFTPTSSVALLDKELEDKEFTFMLKDVSSGVTAGYAEVVTNTLEGNLNFSTIEYTRPGTYTYEISQVRGEKNDIIYDLSKCILTVIFKDNGDGTMELVDLSYKFLNGKEYFENKYSSVPVTPPVIEDDNNQKEDIPKDDNPNTSGNITKFFVIGGMIVLVVSLLIVLKSQKRKRLSI